MTQDRHAHGRKGPLGGPSDAVDGYLPDVAPSEGDEGIAGEVGVLLTIKRSNPFQGDTTCTRSQRLRCSSPWCFHPVSLIHNVIVSICDKCREAWSVQNSAMLHHIMRTRQGQSPNFTHIIGDESETCFFSSLPLCDRFVGSPSRRTLSRNGEYTSPLH